MLFVWAFRSYSHAARLSCLTRRGAVLCVLDASDAYAESLRRTVALSCLGRVRGLCDMCVCVCVWRWLEAPRPARDVVCRERLHSV